MNPTTIKKVVERVVVTFVEAGASYLVVIPNTNWNKAALVGALGAGLSAVYNVVREYVPTENQTPTTISTTPVVVAPMNGVTQIASETTPQDPSDTPQIQIPTI